MVNEISVFVRMARRPRVEGLGKIYEHESFGGGGDDEA